MIYLLAGGIKRPQRVSGGAGPAWYCLDLPPSKLPLDPLPSRISESRQRDSALLLDLEGEGRRGGIGAGGADGLD
jgi:hypothetical protein